MRTRSLWCMVAILAGVPGLALAQHSHAAPAAAHAPAPAAAPAPKPSSEPEWAADDDAMDDAGIAGDFFALGLGDALDFDSLEMGDLAFDGDGGSTTIDETPGPDGRRRIVVRRVEGSGPGGAGMSMHGMGGGMRGGQGMGRRGMGMAMHARMANLDLTDAQRDKMRALHEAFARKAIQRRADLSLARLDLNKLMRADKPDPAAVNAQIDKLARLRADGMKAAFDTHLQAHALLTPEQLKKLKAPMGGGPGMGHGMMDHH